MALALRNNQSYNGQEIVIERPDGSRLTVLAHANPIHDASGTLLGSVNVLVDITEHKRVEAALRSSQQDLADFLEHGAIPLHWVGPDGMILWANQAELDLLGYTREEYIGHHIAEFHADPDVIADIMTRLAQHETLRDYPARLRGKDGSVKHVLIDSNVRWEDGQFIHTRCFTRDISERKRAEEALREADRRKDEFLATLAHELRNPLAPIRHAVEILRLQGAPAPEQPWAVDVIDRQLRQLTRLLDDLLDVSRITAGRLDLRQARVDLAEVLQVAAETSRPLIEEHGQAFALTLPPHPITLDGDLTRLAQVIANLLNNAAKYTDRGGYIWLTAEQRGLEAVVTVRDTGIGIPPELLPRIFEMFMQADRSLERSHSGLGIGLTLARQIVERHGGTLTAHSDGAGTGSAFIIRLPVLPEAAPAPPRTRPAREGQVPVAARRILVVDDERIAAASLGKLLTILGHETRTAYDGLETVGVAEAFRPDVVLLDIGLPKMNGYEVARKIRQQPWGQGMVLIALTGWGQEADRQRARDAGFDHHLVKPVALAALTQMLASL
jgi:PAS domain S-box-containing protein